MNKHNANEVSCMTYVILKKRDSFLSVLNFRIILMCFSNLSRHMLLKALLKYKIFWQFLPNSVEHMFNEYFLPS